MLVANVGLELKLPGLPTKLGQVADKSATLAAMTFHQMAPFEIGKDDQEAAEPQDRPRLGFYPARGILRSASAA